MRAPGFNADDEPWDAWGDEPADPEGYITEDGKCSNCGEQLEFDDLSALDFEVDDGGVSSTGGSYPEIRWATGTIKCPNCQDRLPYEVSS